MYEEPRISGSTSSQVCSTWPSYDCHSCLLCLACLVTPTPDIDLIDIQSVWTIMDDKAQASTA